MPSKALLCSILTLAVSISAAQAASEYITEKGSGRLTVTKTNATDGTFELRSIGANGHQCALEGAIHSGKASLRAGSDEALCLINFKQTPRGIEVMPQDIQPCQAFCGVRAGFDGEYLSVSPECGDAARRKTRDKSLAVYRAKNFQPAATQLEKLLNLCRSTLRDTEQSNIRNDLAVAYFHIEQQEKCLDTLKPILDELTDSRLKFLQQVAPSDYEEWAAISKISKFNQKLCSQPRAH
jgi:hypothetical protein